MLRLPAAAFAALLLLPITGTLAASFPICGGGKRVTCVVDGDTLWLDREKIRLEGIDAPERDGAKCRSERDLAETATMRLAELLSGASITIERTGKDRYGRTLARVLAGGRDVGEILVEDGLARIWRGRREPWCTRQQS